MGKKWIDISVMIKPGMAHWPDNPEIRVERMLDMERGDVCNVSVLSMGSHTGTHMDAPLHFIRDGKSLDQMPPDATIGPCRVIEIKDKESIKVEEIQGQRIKPGERILFKTPNSKKPSASDNFDENFVYISKEAAAYLAKAKIMTVGIDYLSVGGFKKDGVETHHALLGAGIWVIEGLNLARVKPGRYELCCLPLKVLKSDGAPARALLR
ncbi:MAG TPA: cyclase family protein [Verrucomicrobiae bacterium]|jgi:arylformamidase|nr:cyclase family protein [Verrucomicrobiae bacterium]